MFKNDAIDEKARNLVPGSIWESKTGKYYTVLMVTNVSVFASRKLTPEQKSRYPLTVVFLNEENDALSIIADKFLRRYNYVEFDESIARAVDSVYQANLDNGEEQPEPPKEEAKAEAKAEEAPANKEVTADFSIRFVPSSAEAKLSLSADSLMDALAGYECHVDSNGSRIHEFIFEVTNEVNDHSLDDTFNPQFAKETYLYIAVAGAGIKEYTFAWDAYAGVQPRLIGDNTYLVMTLVCFGKRAAQDEDTAVVLDENEPLPTDAGYEVVEPTDSTLTEENDATTEEHTEGTVTVSDEAEPVKEETPAVNTTDDYIDVTDMEIAEEKSAAKPNPSAANPVLSADQASEIAKQIIAHRVDAPNPAVTKLDK